MFQQFPRFLVVGTVGFIVDVSVLSMLVHSLDYSPYWSRLPSFALAVTVTWHLNYHWAFIHNYEGEKLLNFSRYLIVQSVGIGINLFSYAFLLYLTPYFFNHPELSLAIASTIALLFNYLGLSKWIFKSK
ncbi:MAG: hypothetical protein A6F71_02625 [Cycloclasticus sp. symbiont of Poecilosclerida sp. M]|nr:MAG: hypothetical protein A6F71_02625 [Cycloclasticus sp. symbiont of Poecilosclerida sp. M]